MGFVFQGYNLMPVLVTGDTMSRTVRGSVIETLGNTDELVAVKGAEGDQPAFLPQERCAAVDRDAAEELSARPGDRVAILAGTVRVPQTVKAIVDYVGAGSDGSAVLLPLARAQAMLAREGEIRHVLVSIRGDATSGAALTDRVVRQTRVGTRREHVVQMFVFEGLAYDLGAAAVGTALGVGVSYAMVSVMVGAFSTGDLEVERAVSASSLVIAYALGVLLTFVVVAVSAWRVSRLNIVAAVRGWTSPRGS